MKSGKILTFLNSITIQVYEICSKPQDRLPSRAWNSRGSQPFRPGFSELFQGFEAGGPNILCLFETPTIYMFRLLGFVLHPLHPAPEFK